MTMTRKWTLLLIGAVFSLAIIVSAESRTWTDKNGNTLEAEFVKMIGDRVVLKTADKELIVPRAGLDEKDQEYLAAVVPPELEIKVEQDKNVKRLAEAFGYTQKQETNTLKVAIRKTSKQPSSGKFNCAVYMVGLSVGDFYEISRNKVIGYKVQPFTFIENNATNFTATCSTVIDDWIDKKEGWQYDGYLIVVRDDQGKLITTRSSKDTYDPWIPIIDRFKDGKNILPRLPRINR